MSIKMLGAAICATIVAGCASVSDQLADQGFKKMKGAEIAATLVGNSLDGADKNGDYVIHYMTGSSMRISYRGRIEDGVWRVDGDKYCRKWATFGGGKERCVTFFRKGDAINWVRNGKITDRSVVVAGNPAAL